MRMIMTLALLLGMVVVPAAAADAAAPIAAGYHAVPGVRVLDTRHAIGGTTPQARGVIRLPIAGHAGVPATGVSAVVLNVTVTRPMSEGFVTAWPAGTSRPSTTSVTFTAHTSSVADLSVVPLGGGAVDLYNGSVGRIDLLADVVGYYAGSGVAGGMVPLTPARLLDTRTTTAVPAGGTAVVRVAGRAGVPASGASAVVLTLTTDQSRRPGYLTAWSGRTPRPATASMVFGFDPVSTLSVTQIGSDGVVHLYNGSPVPVQVIADVNGYLTNATGGPADGAFVPLTPSRLIDTRRTAAVTPGSTLAVATAGHAGIPALGAGEAVVLLTATSPRSPGYLSAWSGSRPTTSALDFAARQTVANLAVVPIDCNGLIHVTNGSRGITQVVADVVGYVAATHQPCWHDATPALPAGPGTGPEPAYSAASCAAAGECVLVGVTGTTPFAQTQSGQHTTLATLSTPSGYRSLGLPLVSCPTLATCTVLRVVANSASGAGAVVLYRPSAAGWASELVATTPAPADQNLYLSLDCLSSDDCVAAGDQWGIWHNGSWTAATSPGASLGSVSCRGVLDCYAVGDFDNNGAQSPAVEHLDGTTITAVPAPAPSAGGDATGISCVRGGDCVFLGIDRIHAPYADRIAGASSTASALPDPPDEGTAVSCLLTSCTAAAISGDRLVAMTFDGTSWSSTTIPSPPGGTQSPDFRAVTCPVATYCVAIGRAVSRDDLVAVLANGSWSSVAPVPPGGQPIGDGEQAACLADGHCLVVGYYINAAGVGPAYARWRNPDGTWGQVTDVDSSLDIPFGFFALSCTSMTFCVGSTDGRVFVLADGRWTTTTLPNTPDWISEGVSCGGAGSCVVVGQGPSVGEAVWTLSGGTWTVQTLPPVPGVDAGLLWDVSCTDTEHCTAVGEATRTSDHAAVGIAQTLSDGTWTPTILPVRELAVSCASDSECVAVGGPTSARLSGGAWHTLDVAADSVSCPSAGTCTLLSSGQGSGSRLTTLSGDTAGTWAPVAPVTGEAVSRLQSVSCASASVCLAVGYRAATTSSSTAPWYEAYS